jgi:serine/threonine protein kinase
MATGALPFRGESSGTIFNAILERQPVSAVRMNPDLPAKLEDIINRALEKDRDLRYQGAAEMRSEIKRLKRDTDSGQLSGTADADSESPVGGKLFGAEAIETADKASHGSAVRSASAVAHGSGSSVVVETAKRHKGIFISGLTVVVLLIAAAGYGVYSLFGNHISTVPF